MKKTLLFIVLLFVQFGLVHGQNQSESKVEHFPIPIFTNSNLSLLILGSAWDQAPVPGDEIAVRDSNGNIVGISIVLIGHNGLPIWGDNPKTDVKDGLSTGEKFEIIHWNAEKDEYRVFADFKLENGTDTYVKDGFTIVSNLGKSKKIKRTTDLYYHIKSVLSDQTLFSFFTSKEQAYAIKLFRGEELIYDLGEKVYKRGYYSVDYNQELSSGTYSLQLVSVDKIIKTKRFIIE